MRLLMTSYSRRVEKARGRDECIETLAETDGGGCECSLQMGRRGLGLITYKPSATTRHALILQGETRELCVIIEFILLIVTTPQHLCCEQDPKHERLLAFVCSHLKTFASTARTHRASNHRGGFQFLLVELRMFCVCYVDSDSLLSIEMWIFCFCYVDGNAQIQIDHQLHNKHFSTFLEYN